MGDANRFSLVLASQCAAMGEGARIAGLAEAAGALDTALRDPLRGGCAAALADGRSLLLDQDRGATHAAVWEAAERAAGAEGLLVLAWAGHGMAMDGDFYVLPEGSVPVPGHPAGPYHLTQHLRELLRGLPGLEAVVLVDACESGDAPVQAAAGWTRLNQDARRRFQVLSAANTDEPAWDCAFTRAAAALLRGGDITAGDQLFTADVKRAAERAGGDRQQPVLLAWDGAADGTGGSGGSGGEARGLWVARNAALLREAGSLPAFSRADLPLLRAGLRHYRPAPALAEVVSASRAHRYVVVRGPAGFGKTTLLGALSRPEVGAGAVPEGFVHGLRLLKLHESAARVARDLAAQLTVTVDGFRAASEAFEASVPRARWETLPEAERALLGPLRLLPEHSVVRLALDGFDQLSETAAADLAGLVEELRAPASQGAEVRVVVSSRPGAAPPAADTEIPLDAAADTEIRAHLDAQGVPGALLETITEAARGSWLVASLLADHARATPGLTADRVPHGLASVYDQIFDAALDGGAAWDLDGGPERAVFTVLAAAGPGAVLPAEFLADACARLGSPEASGRWLRGGLPAPLRRLTVRAPAGDGGTATELYGLFHQSLADHLTRRSPAGPESGYTVDAAAGHRAIAEAIAALAPADERTPVTSRQPLQEYADRAEPDHLWHSGSPGRALESLQARPVTVPAENLLRWQRWQGEAVRLLGPDHPDTLSTRAHVATWTGEAGDAAAARDLFTALLPDRIRVLGPDDQHTLDTRGNIAAWTGMAGDAATARDLCAELLPDLVRVVGPGHSDTLIIRSNIANWTGEAGDATAALELSTALLPDMTEALGPHHPETLVIRNNIAAWTGKTGDAATARDLLTALLPDMTGTLGPDHPTTLTTRHNIARWTERAGDPLAALALWRELMPRWLSVYGEDHPRTLLLRERVAATEAATEGERPEPEPERDPEPEPEPE
ncbi:tetratricopeptide repeat protein [Streptomyces katsurahamanus]|uniref:ATP-binding protein n=1 Tax=Streptomyces katsurahamanus TaxID=2577098 RepID=A0ABW9NM76_9ACTN|nr:tetratricopeptide repeat protein [Streptomyces katsurahamanus]MQS34417.1 ATP-binding protein [Streptomyces katsurahamanus]